MDLIPDVIPGVGLFDDAVVIGWVITAIRDDLDAFLAWEQAQTTKDHSARESAG